MHSQLSRMQTLDLVKFGPMARGCPEESSSYLEQNKNRGSCKMTVHIAIPIILYVLGVVWAASTIGLQHKTAPGEALVAGLFWPFLGLLALLAIFTVLINKVFKL